MARKVSSRVVLNRQALDKVTLAVAEGVERVVERIVRTARPPDATPFGDGLVTRGGWLVYAGSKKIGGDSLDGSTPKKPRDMRVAGRNAIIGVAGFGFPGRFQELGTVHHAAQPFLWPAYLQVESEIGPIMAPAVRARLAEKLGGSVSPSLGDDG